MIASASSADGVSLEYEVTGEGEPTLVFVHGWGMDRHLWDATCPAVAGAHRLVTLDLGGHGRSGRPRTEWTMESFGDDVAAVVRAVRPQRVILIGHSMGGAVVLEAARRLRDVAAIVLVDTLGDVSQRMPSEQIEGLLAQMGQSYPTALVAMLKQFLFRPTSDPELADRVASTITSGPPEVVLNSLRHNWLYDAAAGFGAVTVPIRAINTDLYPTSVAENRKHAPNYDAVILSGGLSHYPMLEDPAAFNACLVQTLRALST